MSVNSRDETTERWLLTGQELANFVLKSSESLHNVINRAKMSSIQTINGKKKSLKRKMNFRNRIHKNDYKKNFSEPKRIESTQSNDNSNQTSMKTSLEYDFDITWSSSEELNEIPMEELLSSPTWKQIVEQNSFIWP